MAVIVLAGTKGGVGKTTLAAALAVEASRKKKRVAIIDLDGQQSLARWHELRETHHAGNTIVLIPVGKHPDVDIDAAVKAGYDWLIIDALPGSVARTELAVQVADLVVVPVRPSPIDVETMGAITELSEEHGRDFFFVLNQTIPRSSMTQGARSYLQEHMGEVSELEITMRQPHASAMMSGSSAAEAEPRSSAATEIAALWSEIEKRVARTAAKKSALASKKKLA
jgi:chromosome partitioning protein